MSYHPPPAALHRACAHRSAPGCTTPHPPHPGDPRLRLPPLKQVKAALAFTVTLSGAFAVGSAALSPKLAAALVALGALAQALTGAVNELDRDGDGQLDAAQ